MNFGSLGFDAYTPHLLTGLTIAAVLAGTITDLMLHRIPNLLTVGTAVLALSLLSWSSGLEGFTAGLVGGGAMMALMFPFYLLRWMGAGDVKMMMAVGILLGWPDSLLAFAATMGMGSVAAFCLLAWRGGLGVYLRRYWSMAQCLLFTGQFAYIAPPSDEPATQRFPYAFAIALGTLTALAWSGKLGALKSAMQACLNA